MSTKYLSANAALSAAAWLDAPAGSATAAPGASDDANLNGKTLTVDQTMTVANIVGTTGTLAVSGNQTINANVGSATSGFSCTLNGAAQTVTINGNLVGGVTATRITVAGATTTLIVTGNVTGPTASGIRTIAVSAGFVTITGNVTGGSSANQTATLSVSDANSSITINGNVTGGSSNNLAAIGAQVIAGTLTVNGNVAGGTGTGNSLNAPYGVSAMGGTLNVTGSLLATSTISAVVVCGGTFNYTPNPGDTILNGGKTLYPTRLAHVGGTPGIH